MNIAESLEPLMMYLFIFGISENTIKVILRKEELVKVTSYWFDSFS
jgi:hypothetical protein